MQAPIKTSVNRCLDDLVHTNSAAVTTPAGDAFLAKVSSPDFWPFRIASQTTGSVTISGDFS